MTEERHRAMPAVLRTLRAGARLVAYVVVDWVYVAAWQVYALATSSDVRQYLDPPGRKDTAVIMIPGVYEPWRFMKPLSDMLYRHGYPVHVIAGLGYNTRQVPVMAYLVHRFVVTSGIERAVVIAHSKGGLIGKYVLAHYNEDDRIRHLIAINTPFSGSVYADFAPVGHVRIFSRRDAIITRLRMNEIVNSRITSLYSKFDPTIPHSSYLEGATNLTLDTIGHFHVVSSKRLHAMVLDVLERVEASADD